MKIRYCALLINSRSRLPLNSGYDTSTATLVAMFAQVNTLPDAQVKSAISNWNINTGTKEAILYVGRHVVVTFIVMPVVRGFFRHKLIEVTFQVLAYCRVGILINRQ